MRNRSSIFDEGEIDLEKREAFWSAITLNYDKDESKQCKKLMADFVYTYYYYGFIDGLKSYKVYVSIFIHGGRWMDDGWKWNFFFLMKLVGRGILSN